MKKKKLSGKLSLEKSKISSLNSLNITGGNTTTTTDEVSPDSEVFCVISRNNDCVSDNPLHCTTGGPQTGSFCKCK